MNSSQVEGIARLWLVALVATIGALGYMKGVNFGPIIALAATGIGTWWSFHSNKTTSLVAAVQASPTVDHVQMATHEDKMATPALAQSPKVHGPVE